MTPEDNGSFMLRREWNNNGTILPPIGMSYTLWLICYCNGFVYMINKNAGRMTQKVPYALVIYQFASENITIVELNNQFQAPSIHIDTIATSSYQRIVGSSTNHMISSYYVEYHTHMQM